MADPSQHKQQKFSYYVRPDIVEQYESSRFGRPSGRWIRDIEEAAIANLIAGADVAQDSTALDLATGTGRNIPLLSERAETIVACDLSFPMLGVASERAPGMAVNCDAGRIPIVADSISIVLASRFFFHFDDLGDFFAEINRILKPGGYLIFDVCNWTPRTWIPGRQNRIGGRMYLHRRDRVEKLAAAHGFTVDADIGTFGMPPYLYQHLPLPLVRLIEAISTVALLGYRNKVYYRLRKR